MVDLEETWVGAATRAPVRGARHGIRSHHPVLLVGGDHLDRSRVVDLLTEVVAHRPLVRTGPEPRTEILPRLGDLVASVVPSDDGAVVAIVEEAHHRTADEATALVRWADQHGVDLLLTAGRAAGGRFLAAGCDVVDLGSARIDLGRWLLRRTGRTAAPPVVEALLDQVADDPESLLEMAGRLSVGHLAGWIELPVPLPVDAAPGGLDEGKLSEASRRALGLVALARVPTAAVIDDAAEEVGLDPSILDQVEGQGLLRRTDALRWVVDPAQRAGLAAALTGVERRASHAALGRATARRVPSAALPATRHLVAAGVQPVSALVEQLRVIADHARGREAFEVAIRADAEAALLTPPGAARTQLLLQAAELAWEAGRGAWAQGLLAAARADEDGEHTDSGMIFLETKVAAARPGGIDLHGSLLEAAAVARSDPAAACDRCLAVAMVGVMRAQFDHAGAAAAQALRHAGEDRLRGALAAAWQVGIDVLTTSRAGAFERVDAAEDAIVTSLADPRSPGAPAGPVVEARCWLLLNRLAFDQLDAVRLGSRELIGGLTGSGRLGLVPLPVGTLALAEFRRGWWDAAIEHGQRATALATTSGQPALAANGSLAQAWVAAARGEAGSVAEHLRPVRHAAEVEGAELLLGIMRAVQGLLELSTDAPERAVVHLEQARAYARTQRIIEPRFLASAGDLLDAYLAVGERGAADALLDELRGSGQQDGWIAGVVARGEALLRVDGRWSEAFARSCDAFAGIPMPFEEARSRLAWALAAERAGDLVVARQQAVQARVLFGDLGAVPWAARAAAVATRAQRIVDAGGRWESLTEQELRIARLVASGSSNREVAERCHVSPKTVEYHLRHIFEKLGLRNRTQLAALRASLPPRLTEL